MKKQRKFVRMFSDEFSWQVRDGLKTQTIRKTPSRMPKKGDLIDCRMWEGKAYRSKQRIIGVFEISKVTSIKIQTSKITLESEKGKYELGLYTPLADFAKDDGFMDWDHLVRWFTLNQGRLPFKGILIEWDFESIKEYDEENI